MFNQTDAFVLSWICPRGLNAATGEAALAVQANATASFIARNIGLYTGRGPGLAGQRFQTCGVLGLRAPSIWPCFWRPSLLPKVPIAPINIGAVMRSSLVAAWDGRRGDFGGGGSLARRGPGRGDGCQQSVSLATRSHVGRSC